MRRSLAAASMLMGLCLLLASEPPFSQCRPEPGQPSQPMVGPAVFFSGRVPA